MEGERPDFHIITGGPGAGKTSLIEELRARGHACVDEVGRAIIRQQRLIGGNALHTGDRGLFLELMLSWSIADYERASTTRGPVFFDRGIPELVGYCHLVGMPVPLHVRAAAERFVFARRVFVAPPWPEIYGADAERGQSLEEAEATHAAVTAAYRSFGYETVDLPRTSIAGRADFIERRVLSVQTAPLAE